MILKNIDLDQIDNEAKIELIGEIWESIDHDKLPIPDGHKKALDESTKKYGDNPSTGTSWDDFKKTF